jgi:methylated-DNA-[protein]-cysteine S-methyltransferase
VLLPRPDKKSLASKVDANYWGVSGSHPNAEKMADAVMEYFKGNFSEIEWPPLKWLDFDDLTPLEKKVLSAVAKIPYGQTRSYKEIAELVAKPKAYRFVGSTMAKNPFPILIPCHRVVRSDRSVGGFGGGPEMKRKMIEMEASFVRKHTT